MNIALIGYGKMGREVERLAVEAGDDVVGIFDIDPPASVEGIRSADVCIEFSTPEAVLDNMRLAAEAQVSIVVGTTGWYDQLPEVRTWFKDSAMIYAQNFSIGVNVFYRILRRAAQLMEAQPQYDVFVEEQHHKGKVDSPSGTALKMSEILLQELTRKTSILKGEPKGPIRAEDLQISSVRAGAIPGSHMVGFDSEADAIELRHSAKNRSGFALGALEAARWVRGRRGVFTMDDVDL
jgi:4-hydroxy-tetrahydrodipicolinate reductase